MLSLPFLKPSNGEHAVKPSGSAGGGACSAALTSLGQQQAQSSESPILFSSGLRSEGKAWLGISGKVFLLMKGKLSLPEASCQGTGSEHSA